MKRGWLALMALLAALITALMLTVIPSAPPRPSVAIPTGGVIP
jgi:hypothetical protein